MVHQLEIDIQTTPQFVELQRMGPGKSFGEKALIANAPRVANVVCTRDCHLAVVLKSDYEKLLHKMEVKTQNKMIAFL